MVSISVKIRNLSDVGAIISGVTTRGANRINGPRFVVDDPDAAQTQAREEAIKKAKEKAETLAKAGDFRLGKVLSISDNFGGGYPEPYFAEDSVRNFGGAVSKEAPQAAVAPDIQPGSQDIKATVTITYEIK